jgi:aminoglycoside/choline kinase family phosphotransferase
MPPPDASRPDVWKEAIALVSEERAPARTCFLHCDYQHFNMLWSRERLTGVVDWSEARLGPPEVDVGHCRLNLAVLFSAGVADRFAKALCAACERGLMEPRFTGVVVDSERVGHQCPDNAN